MRVTDEEKLALEEMTRNSSKSISSMMCEAIMLYSPLLKNVMMVRESI